MSSKRWRFGSKQGEKNLKKRSYSKKTLEFVRKHGNSPREWAAN